MVDKVVSDLVTIIERELHEVAGSSVQTYSEPVIIQKIQTRFDIIFEDRFWERFRTFETLALDGVTGKPTTQLVTITEFGDIQYVYPLQSDEPLKNVPERINPANIAGTYPRFFAPDPTTVFKILPIQSTISVVVMGRARPAAFNTRSVIPFDYLSIAYGVCAEICIDDGMNSNMAQKFMKQYEDRLQKIRNAEPDEIMLNPYKRSFPHSWYPNA